MAASLTSVKVTKDHLARHEIFSSELAYLAKFGRAVMEFPEPIRPDEDANFVWAYLGYCMTQYKSERLGRQDIIDLAMTDLQVLHRAHTTVLGRLYGTGQSGKVVDTTPTLKEIPVKDRLEKQEIG